MGASVFKDFTKHQWVCFILCGSMCFINENINNMIAPLYPEEAEKKQVSATIYGSVIAVFQLVMIFVPPAVSVLIPIVGTRPTFNIAVVVAGISVISFGLLDFVNSFGWFVGLSYLLQILSAIGSGGVFVSIFACLSASFPNSVISSVLIAVEIAGGVGCTTGPFIASVLYELGSPSLSYLLPFLVIGGLLFVVGSVINCAVVFPKKNKNVSKEAKGWKSVLSYFGLLRAPGISYFAISLAISGMNDGFLSALLEPYLRQFHNVRKLVVGSMFLLESGTYTISCIVLSQFADKLKDTKLALLIIIGSFGFGVAFWFLDPAFFLPVARSLWLSIIALLVMGIANSFINIPAYLLLLRALRNLGLPQELQSSYSSSLWLSSYSFGSFFGRFLGGALEDLLGFNNTFFVTGCINMALGLLMTSDCIKIQYAPEKSGLTGLDPEEVPLTAGVRKILPP